MKTRIRNVFIGKNRIRFGWLLAAAAIMYLLSAGGVYYLYWSAYSFMMGIWGVTSENIIRAPAVVQFLYQWSNVIVQLLQSVMLIASAIELARMDRFVPERHCTLRGIAQGAGMGAACIVGLWCVLMLTGSVRLGWHITQPAFSVNTFALLLTTAVSAAAEGVFLYGAVYGVFQKRLPVWAAIIIAALMRVLMQGVFSPVIILNNALTALLCCLLTEKRGFGAAISFRFAWDYLAQAVFGFAGYTAALYETYPVNLYWLSGENAGIMSGVLTSIVLIGACALLMKSIRKVQSKS